MVRSVSPYFAVQAVTVSFAPFLIGSAPCDRLLLVLCWPVMPCHGVVTRLRIMSKYLRMSYACLSRAARRLLIWVLMCTTWVQ